MHSIPDNIAAGLKRADRLPAKDRILFWANEFLGKPFIENPLGEGENAPRIRFDAFDCMSLVETCLAMSISKRPDDLLPNMDRIRYRDGHIGFRTRNHFVSADWLPANNWLLKRLDNLADAEIERTIDRRAFFAEKRTPLSESDPVGMPERVVFPCVSRDAASGLRPGNIDSAVVMFVGRDDGIVVRHMGLVFARPDIVLCHASSDIKVVENVGLFDYININKEFIGMTFAVLR